MGLELTIFAILWAGGFVAAILFLVFAQVTVRKLEKNPETKQALGFEFTSGWRIVNVAKALVFPLGFFRITSRSPLSFLNANAELLLQHTNRADRFLAHAFYWTWMSTGVGLVLFMVLSFSGFFDWYAAL